MKKYIAILLLVALPFFAHAQSFGTSASYETCFTPGQDCTAQIIDLINNSKSELLVMGYSFTSEPIAEALAEAKSRGIDVRVILDKGQKSHKSSSLTYLKKQGIPVWIDYRPAIAHNKVLIVDRKVVQTGSFNYTQAAQKRNSENVLIIRDAGLAKEYAENWEKRLERSKRD